MSQDVAMSDMGADVHHDMHEEEESDREMSVDSPITNDRETPDSIARAALKGKGRAKPAKNRAKARTKAGSIKATTTTSGRATPDSVLQMTEREGSQASTSNVSMTREGSPYVTSSSNLKETDTTNVPVSSLFTSYVPDIVSDSEDEDQAAQSKRGKRNKTKLREFGKPEDDEEQDDRLYCVCRKLYDPDRIMICCDKCEDWYHLDCVGIREERVELIDDFFCPLCTEKYNIETTYNRQCARPHCLHACSPLSKYCSDYCGTAVAAARLKLDGIDPERLWRKVAAASRRQVDVYDVELGTSLDIEVVEQERRSQLASRLDRVVSDQSTLDRLVSMLDKRLQYLARAIRRWEALCQATADQLASEGITSVSSSTKDETKKPSKKSKKAVSATSLPEAQCGFDLRLVDEDQEWTDFVESEQGKQLLGEDELAVVNLEDLSGVCLEPRKKCDRHQGWQKVREADFEVEKSVLTRRLEALATRERKLRQQLEEHDERVKYRLLNEPRKSDHPLNVRKYMEQHDRFPLASPKRRATSPGAGAGRASGKNGKVNGKSKQQEKDQIPDDVWAFLSRSEQAQLRAQGRHA